MKVRLGCPEGREWGVRQPQEDQQEEESIQSFYVLIHVLIELNLKHYHGTEYELGTCSARWNCSATVCLRWSIGNIFQNLFLEMSSLFADWRRTRELNEEELVTCTVLLLLQHPFVSPVPFLIVILIFRYHFYCAYERPIKI